jgi:hypothetical protein
MHRLSNLRRPTAFAVRFARRWGCGYAPLWLLLVAFTGHATLPPAMFGSLAPRALEEETDTLKAVWKCNAGQSRTCAQARTLRRTSPDWMPPTDCLPGRDSRSLSFAADHRTIRGEIAERNGCGAPLRC